jgi:hypothetical protein
MSPNKLTCFSAISICGSKRPSCWLLGGDESAGGTARTLCASCSSCADSVDTQLPRVTLVNITSKGHSIDSCVLTTLFTSCCEHGNEHSGSMRGKIFLDQLSQYRHPKKDSAPWVSFLIIPQRREKEVIPKVRPRCFANFEHVRDCGTNPGVCRCCTEAVRAAKCTVTHRLSVTTSLCCSILPLPGIESQLLGWAVEELEFDSWQRRGIFRLSTASRPTLGPT